jgi:hypothetical protein
MGKIPQVECAIIWLDRDPREQAKSQLKFVSMVAGVPIENPRAAAKHMERSLRADRPRALNSLPSGPRLLTSFELAIRDPELFATQIADFVKRWHTLDIRAMRNCVKTRRNGIRCEADLAMEMELCD